MPYERLTRDCTATAYHIHNARRHAGRGDELHQARDGQWRVFCRLGDTAVAEGNGSGDLHGGQCERRIPRADQCGDADGLAGDQGEVAGVLRGDLPGALPDEFGEEFEIQRGAWNLAECEVAHGNAGIEAFEVRQLWRMLTDEPSESAQDGLTLGDLHARPWTGCESRACCEDSAINDDGAGLFDLAHLQLGGGIDHRQRKSGARG